MKSDRSRPVPPQPSVSEMQQRLANELSLPTRVFYSVVLFVDIAVAVVVLSLWLTEPPLPLRTQLAFGGMLLCALVWASVLGWTLSRRKVVLARQKVILGRIAVLFSGLFVIGASALAWTTPNQRGVGLAAAAMGLLLLAVAGWILNRSVRRYRQLVERAQELARDAGGSPTSASKLLLPTLLVAAFSVLVGDHPGFSQQVSDSPIEVMIHNSLIPIVSLGQHHVVYELHLTNFGLQPRRLAELAVVGVPGVEPTDHPVESGEVTRPHSRQRSGHQEAPLLHRWNGSALAQRLSTVGTSPTQTGHSRVLEPGRKVVAFLWLPLPQQGAPTALRHRLVTEELSGKGRRALLTEPVPLASASRQGRLSAPPVGPGRWVALRGPSNGSGHRRSLVTLSGATRVPQRFAIDWARLGEQGRLYRGHGKRNEDWHGFGEVVRATAAGIVVAVIDGIPDHQPLSREAAQKYTHRSTITGNTLVIDEGDQRFSIYAHLRNDSIIVRQGDAVDAGQQIAEVGNSGHSLAPHLHYHLSDRPDPLAGEGLPYGLVSYRLEGRLDSLGSAVAGRPWSPSPTRPPRAVEGELPLENMVVSFR